MIPKLMVWLALAAASAFAQPAEIVIFRHAEKPTDDSIPHLSNRGYERAALLPFYLTATPPYTNFGVPVALFAAKATAASPSVRSIETVTPYSREIGVPIQTPFSAHQFSALATEVLGNPNYSGKTVVICWPHDQIPLLAGALGVAKPPKWRSTDFDHALVLRYNAGKPQLWRVPERLLYRDSTL